MKKFLFFVIPLFFILITDVNAGEIYTAPLGYSNSSPSQNLDIDITPAFAGMTSGTLSFSFAIYDESVPYITGTNNKNWNMVANSIFVTSGNGNYNCSFSAFSNPRDIVTSMMSTSIPGTSSTYTVYVPSSAYELSPYLASYSATCRVYPGATGITQIHIRGIGFTYQQPTTYYFLSNYWSFELDTSNDYQLQSSLQAQTNAINTQTEEIKKQTEESKKTNDLLESDNVDDADEKASGFFSNFDDNGPGGLSDVITVPLNFLQNLTSSSCSPVVFPLPFVNKTISLPCMKSIFQQHFGIFYTFWVGLINGVIAYKVLINFVSSVKRMKNPDDDKIEVLDL